MNTPGPSSIPKPPPPPLFSAHGRLAGFFRLVLLRRWWVAGAFLAVTVPAVYFAARVQQDNSPDRLMIRSDPAYVDGQAFNKIFGGGDVVLLVAEAPDPLAPDVVARVDGLERALAALPHVQINSALRTFRQARGVSDDHPVDAAAFAAFARGTDLFRRQTMLGDGFLAIPLILESADAPARKALLDSIDQVLAPAERSLAPLTALRKVGASYVNAWLDLATRAAVVRCFPLFGAFVIVMIWSLYRSARALAAILLSLLVSTALTVGFVGLTGGLFTIVSSLVPMTVLTVCTSTLVYLHSRFISKLPEQPLIEHHIEALTNKFLPCTASIFATAVGFAALGVSKIRPIREMGLWVAVGLVLTWITVFTLFPALQSILRTPTAPPREDTAGRYQRTIGRLPRWSYRYRAVLLVATVLLSASGVVALFGWPGLISPMKLQTDTLEYIGHENALYRDTRAVEKNVTGLGMTEVWLDAKTYGLITDVPVLRGLYLFQSALEREPGVRSVAGPATIVRMMRYVGGQGDAFPVAEAEEPVLEGISAQLDSLIPKDPNLSRVFDAKNLNQTHLTVVTNAMDHNGYDALDQRIRTIFAASVAETPALAAFTLRTVGLGPLEAKISYYLVPTLVQSFGLTVGVIFFSFLLVFRNGAARLMAMVPSLFAILVMFSIMRLLGMTLNIATILIASTVLGSSENDQIHFFFHFSEKRGESAEKGLRHALSVAGSAIIMATLINTVGFLAFATSGLPPIRQFGLLSAVALVLSMVADFTALPAALWVVLRERPDPVLPAQ